MAVTRARETLVVGTWSGTRASSPWSDLSPMLADCPELPCTSSAKPVVEDDGLVPNKVPPAPETPSWTRAAAAFKQPSAHLKPLLPPDAVNVDAREWGRLIHRLLEHMVRRPTLDQAELTRLGRWFCHEVPGLSEALPAALDVVEELKSTLLWDWIAEARVRLVEVPFGVREGRRILFGTIDLALHREEAWALIDYKTDRQRVDALVESYARQIEQYARSWAQVTDEPLRYTGLFGVREGMLSGDLRPP